MLGTVTQRHTGIDTDTRTDSQDSIRSGTDLDPSADKEWMEDGKCGAEFKSGLTLDELSPKGSAFLCFLIATLVHYW